MKILFVYPSYPDTFWGFKHALKFVSKKAAYPPLGLLTVAAMLPDAWKKKLVDMNIASLTDNDIKWSDYVFISAMVVQKDSVKKVIAQCNRLGAKIVAGGPLFTTGYEEFNGVDHFVLGEAEVTLQPFLKELEEGRARHIYTSDEWPDLSTTPIPQWSLINMKHYSSMSLQYSRGCPYDCEFCNIITLNGNIPRTKSSEQLVSEMNTLYELGWRGNLFIVDDNFIGNKKKLKAEILPSLIKWRANKKHPFVLNTETSINLADDYELVQLMIAAGFDTVFIGIETPNKESLMECAKTQNQNRDLITSIKKLQRFGLEVQGGFIIGFDSDKESIFQNQIEFIQESGIVTAMVGLLNAPLGTKLHKRLEKENRLLKSFSGDNTDYSLNFIPKMDYNVLINGYRRVLDTIYSPKEYYERIGTFLQEYRPPKGKMEKVPVHRIKAFLKSIWILGIYEEGKWNYWKLFVSYLLKSPKKFARFITLAIYGYHFRKISVTQI